MFDAIRVVGITGGSSGGVARQLGTSPMAAEQPESGE
jgi:hypothetical protein